MIVWMNLYRDGYYHRRGKPWTLGLHPGDLYGTKTAAELDIDKDAPFLATVGFALQKAALDAATGSKADTDRLLTPYPADSTPVPLRETRKNFGKPSHGGYPDATRAVPSHIVGMRPLLSQVLEYQTGFEQRAAAAEENLQ